MVFPNHIQITINKEKKKEKIPVHCQNNWIPFNIFFVALCNFFDIILADKIYFTAKKGEEKI